MTSETSDSPPSPLDEEEMGTQLSRLAKPVVLVAPLVVAVLLPAFLYGQRSRQVASDADRELVASFTTVADGPAMTLSHEAFCDPADAETMTTTFAELDLDGDNHKSSVTGLGFERVTVDLKGWVEEPSPSPTSSGDDIIIELRRSGRDWCVTDVRTRVAAESE